VQVGVIGLCGAGAHIVRRLLAGGHQCVVFDTSPRLVAELAAECAYGVASLKGMAHELDPPRVILLSPPAAAQGAAIAELLPHLDAGDIVAAVGPAGDPGENARRAGALAAVHVQYITVASDQPLDGPRPCCLAVDGEDSALQYVEPVLAHIAPTVRRTAPGSAIDKQ
jgi:6-phosphogluconate dehydrogenase